ncbi:hypothetical protein SAMN04487848_0956 [Microbacterium sp. ru370.1]|uniref:glycosyltransferase n=1 Tax=unclassified Microbacterium TaxID=2609290 RepID=UPI00088E37C7|nr:MULTISPECIES: glycosyltransferase [unclassified Microbacterium]SDO45135.1 hypothetical protein SAMN04487848_0956 [Microbacterium sp. ru370.1]SIT81240.1 hypothetical protein SAMN05880579_0952 [Microbacterium sp. RU1D]
MPKVSVITGFYNRAHLLDRTIDSIMKQTLTDFELIVFDDASRDGTAQRLLEKAAELNDERFTFVTHAQNQGFVRGLIDAISRSSGEYIAIQGSGDSSLPRRLELQSALLDARPEVGVVGGWYYNVQDDLGTERLRRPDANDMTLKSLLHGNKFSHGEVMIRRSALERAGGYREEFTFAQDYDLWLRIARDFRFATVPEPLYRRHVQFDGVSYDPAKIIRHASYSLSARRLALMPSAQMNQALKSIRENGPESVVPADDPDVQKKVIQAVLRLVIFGSPEAGERLARTSMTSTPRRIVLQTFARIYGSKPARLFTPLVRRAVGMTRAAGAR